MKQSDFSSNHLKDAPQTKWIALLLLIVFMSPVWAISPLVNDIRSESFYKFIVFVFLLYKTVDSEKRMEWFLGVYCLGTFYISWVGWQMGRSGNGRLEGTGSPDSPDVNGAAALIVTAVPILLFYCLYGKRRWIQFGSLISLAFVLNCLILMSSRGAFLAVVGCCLYFAGHAMLLSGVSKNVKTRIILGAIAGVALFVYLADAAFWERIVTLKSIDIEEGTGGATRINFWLATFDMLANHPLGLGAGGYEELSPRFLPAEWLSRGGGVVGKRAVHSTWFEVLACYGYQGLLVFLCYVASTFLMMRRLRVFLRRKGTDIYQILQSVAIESAFIGFLVASTFMNRFFSETMFWLPALMAAFVNVYMVKSQRDTVSGSLIVKRSLNKAN